MTERPRLSASRIAVWVLLVLLIAGLAAFGISDILRGGLSNSIASVGDRTVTVQDYEAALDRQLRIIARTEGRALTAADARALGIDRAVLAELVRGTALDIEAERRGIGVSLETVRAAIAEIPEFRGIDGRYSAEQARLVLEANRITEAELAEDIERSLVRGLLRSSLFSGAGLPESFARALLVWQEERRGFAWVRLDPLRFGGDPADPTAEEMAAHHAANAARFTRPETRVLAYALLDPVALAEALEVPEAELRAAYDARAADYIVPERRSVRRLAFPDMAGAEAAKARLAAGETTLAALAAERGLSEADLALGEIAATALPEAARAAVFGLAAPGLAGPVATDLGPALFQVDAILAGRTVGFEEARAALRAELARTRARDEALKLAARVEDLVAEGARVEEIAREAGLVEGRLELPVTGPAEGLAADPKLREAALAAEPGRETDPVETAGGQVVVLRVEEVRPAALRPLAEVEAEVRAALLAERRLAAARTRADRLAADLRAGRPFAQAALGLGLTPAEAAPLTRGAVAPGLPSALVAALFAPGEDPVIVVDDPAGPVVALRGATEAFDPSLVQNAQLLALYRAAIDQRYEADLFQYFGAAIEAREGTSYAPALLDTVLARLR